MNVVSIIRTKKLSLTVNINSSLHCFILHERPLILNHINILNEESNRFTIRALWLFDKSNLVYLKDASPVKYFDD